MGILLPGIGGRLGRPPSRGASAADRATDGGAEADQAGIGHLLRGRDGRQGAGGGGVLGHGLFLLLRVAWPAPHAGAPGHHAVARRVRCGGTRDADGRDSPADSGRMPGWGAVVKVFILCF